MNWKGWEEKGIHTIGDLCHNSENTIMSHTEITEKFSIPCSFLEALSIRLSIPTRWKHSLTTNWQDNKPERETIDVKLHSNPPKDIANLTPKTAYASIIEGKDQKFTAQARWEKGDDGVQMPTLLHWSLACERIYSSTRKTKLQAFQFKLIHRIVPCRTYLKQIRIVDSDKCPICGKKDSIIHFFYWCETVAAFWSGVCGWFKRAEEEIYLDHLTPEEFLFGIPKDHRHSAIINNIVLNVKYYIHREKLFHEGKLELFQWLQEFRAKLQIERWICNRTGKAGKFNILSELG